jgi:hypothetical protein
MMEEKLRRSGTMDVLAQASNVVEQAEARHGRVTLVLDLDDPAQRAAYAAALAVLQINGIDPLTLAQVSDAEGAAAASSGPVSKRAATAPDEGDRADDREPYTANPTAGDKGEDVGANPADAAIWRSYAEALGALTPDEARANQIVRETFPRVRELLRDGANVEAVAQIQYRRWTEEHLDTSRN